MHRTLKVFCTGADQDRLAENLQVVARYEGFLIAEISEDKIADLTRRYPIEDITDLYIIQVGDRTINTSQPRIDVKGKLRAHPAYKGVKKLTTGPHHHLVQFIGPIKEQWLKKIEKAGGQPRTPHGAFTYIVRADAKTLQQIRALPFVRWVGHLSHRDRIESSVLPGRGFKSGTFPESLPRTKILPGLYTVEFFSAKDLKVALADVKKIGFEVVDQDKNAAIAVIEDPKGGAAAAKRLRELSAIHGVRFIRKRAFKRTSNDVAGQIMGTRATLSAADLGLSGKGEVIAVCDTGLDNADLPTIHQDFAGRIKALMSYPITQDFASYVSNPGDDDGAADLDSGHGTHVAGSVLGNGATSLNLPGNTRPIRGLAYQAQLVFQAIEQEMKWKNPAHYQSYGRYLLSGIPLDLTRLFTDAYQQKARIHSNSWGGGQPGEYDSQSEQLDRFVWEHKDFCVLVACGNDGTDQDGDGKINPMSVTSPATAKNCITVGACENERSTFDTNTYGAWWPQDYPVAPYRSDPMANNADQVAAFSSRGPTRDGRVKPEVVAPGTFILSTRSTMIAPNNTAWSPYPPSKLYYYMGGTSMATPLTAGAIGLIREYLRTRMAIKDPTAALLKATLIAGAKRLVGYGAPGAVVDNDQGYGRVNLDAILAPPGATDRGFVEITPGLRTGEVHTTNIDVRSTAIPLRVVMAYSDYPGPSLVNNLNLILVAPDGQRYAGNQAIGTSLTMDVKNNVEVIHIPNPEPGSWTLQVVGSNIPHGPQEFALVYLAQLSGASEKEEIYEEVAPDLAIPDDDATGVTSTIAVSRPGIIGSVKVGVNITHTYIGDLRLVLSAPDNTRIVLHERTGASTDDLVKTYDVHTTPDLAQLNGKSASGDWKLMVSDNAGIDVGKLRRWDLSIQLASSRQVEQDSSPSVAIPDNDPAGISDSIDIIATGNVSAVNVWVDITHTWVGDLRVKLASPAGEQIVLHDRSGKGQDNLIKTYTAENLAAIQTLVGQSAQGTWTLSVTDLAGRDLGKLNRWGLQLTL
ncbi:MAG: S8 family serine peptidase [Desulfobacteraceae bacterium]|jgi:subtilisin-like proprotein convertase family protein|nr:S8 family serine peptidase [Desulfobacteraceae bacterium]